MSRKGINFTFGIDFSQVNFIIPIDVSSTFNNILDNTIEACDKIMGKNIRIK
ncbi:GHKL domain-containing protein [Clostridioides difficile]|uniref:GHKL domain-containing protein n=1 Tax=Clostridioides difficile TaxID=1496 RepID=UPI001FAB8B30|nr:GHKL domain-containing protein [Clostridioides difficile]